MSSTLAKAHVVGSSREPGKSRQLGDSPWSNLYAEGEVVEPPYDLEALAALYESNATNKACVDAKVTNIVGLGYRFISTGPESQEADLARLHALFDDCNLDMTFTEVMRAVWSDVESTGNGYVEITRDGEGELSQFYHVPSTTMRVCRNREKFFQMRDGKRQEFWVLGHGRRHGDRRLSEILHLKKYTPESSYYGVPDIIAALASVAGDRAAREYNLDFFEHNAVPRMAIIVEGGRLSDEVIRQVQHFMESEVRGQGHKTLLLDVAGQDVKIRMEPLTVGMQDDAAFLAYRKANRDEVMMVHRVPPSKITVVENANLANSRDQDKTFREQVVRPEQTRIEHQLNKLIRDELGIKGWAFDFLEMDLGEEREHAEIARIYGELGVWDVDEIRARQGLRPKGGE